MDRLIPVLILLAVLAVLFFLMWKGWKNRQASQTHIPEPPRPTRDPSGPGHLGMYVATTYATDPLERINVHHLGVRTNGTLHIEDDRVVFMLDGIDGIEIPFTAIDEVTTASGMVGKFVEKDGLVVIVWTLGDTQVATGFRPRLAHARTEILESLALTEKVK